MWAPVWIEEGEGVGDTDFKFIPDGSKPSNAQIQDKAEGSEAAIRDNEVLLHPDSKGWVVCPWAMGHPQLFYLTDAFVEGKLPDFCERVSIIREEVKGQY